MEILARLGKGESLRSIARDVGMSHEAIRYIGKQKGEKQMNNEMPTASTITVEDLWQKWETALEKQSDVSYLSSVVADIILYLAQQRQGEK
jgi:orotate phosphoribosyltransferase-like protein